MKKVLILMMLVVCSSSFAEDAERIEWDKKPISITLPIDKERMVIFPSDVRVKVPPMISHQLRTISNEGIIYWKADAPFEKQRVKVQIIETGKIIMIDLAASAKRTKVSPIKILVGTAVPVDQVTGSSRQSNTGLDFVQLTRFAAKSLYAPERLISTPLGVTQVQLNRSSTDTLIRGQIIKATPISSWQSNGVYVTAVKLKNLTSSKIVLDPRSIRGTWEAATFQHVTLAGKGSSEDTTSLYLISHSPYEESL